MSWQRGTKAEGRRNVRYVFAAVMVVGFVVLSFVVFDLGISSASVGGETTSLSTALQRSDETRSERASGVLDAEVENQLPVESRSALVTSSNQQENFEDVAVTSPPDGQRRSARRAEGYAHRGDNDVALADKACAKKEDRGSSSRVVLAGNRPVGTYLCEYFPSAERTSRGCNLQCQLPHRFGGAPFTCEILNKAEPAELFTSDIVVNHFGPVPEKKSGRPYITLFYQGESKAADGKRALMSYLNQYDRIISFSTSFKYHYTWTNRYLEQFRTIQKGGDGRAVRALLGGSVDEWNGRKSAIAVFVSRCKKGGRDWVIKSLAQHYTVHSFGKCARTHSIAEVHPDCAAINKGRYPEKACVFKKYKFILALDNTRELDYVTEKVYHALLAGAIPIYDGAPNAEAFIPGGMQSVVQMQAFRANKGVAPSLGNANNNNHDVDFAALANHLKAIEASRDLQAGYFEWRTEPQSWSSDFIANMEKVEPTCEVCADALEKKRCESNN